MPQRVTGGSDWFGNKDQYTKPEFRVNEKGELVIYAVDDGSDYTEGKVLMQGPVAVYKEGQWEYLLDGEVREFKDVFSLGDLSNAQTVSFETFTSGQFSRWFRQHANLSDPHYAVPADAKPCSGLGMPFDSGLFSSTCNLKNVPKGSEPMQVAYAGLVKGKDSQEVEYVGMLLKTRITGLNGPEDVFQKILIRTSDYFYTKEDGTQGVSEAWNDMSNYSIWRYENKSQKVALTKDGEWAIKTMKEFPGRGEDSDLSYYYPDYFYFGVEGWKEHVQEWNLTSAQAYYDMITYAGTTSSRDAAVYSK
jgi:hypothetical protein